MNELIAKVELEHKIVLSQQKNILDDFSTNKIEKIDFTPGYKLDEEEWFIIKQFSVKEFFIDICNPKYSSASLNQIKKGDYEKTSVIIIIQNGHTYFQRITPSLFIFNKTFLDYSGEPKIVTHKKHLVIRNKSDAVYDFKHDILYFKDIGKLKIIFPGIETLQREATQNEVDEFVKNDFISLDGMNRNRIGTLNRKRIGDIGTKYSNLSNEKKKALISYAKKNAGVEIADNKFVVKTDTDLKNILYAMDQRYYYADIFEENRLANSVRVIK